MEKLWILCPLIFLAGVVDSIAGGGGLISLSGYLAVGLPPHLALGTNKFSSTVGTGIAAARFAKKGYVEWLSTLCALAGALAGSFAGARLALLLPESVLHYCMLALIAAVAVFLILKRDFGSGGKVLAKKKMAGYSLLIGVAIGAYDGFFGPGTGTFLILAFTAVLGLETVYACGNTKFVNLASNVAALVTFILQGNVDYVIGIPCMLCGILGNYLGSGLAIRRGVKIVRPVMFAVIGMLFVKLIVDLL